MKLSLDTGRETLKGKFLTGLRLTSKRLRLALSGILLAVGVLAPYTLMHGTALPPPDEAGRVALMEVAGLYDESSGVSSTFLARLRRQGASESEILAVLLLLAALTAEQQVTRDMCALATGRRRLAGLAHRVKGRTSLARKIESDAQEKQLSLRAAAWGISDVLRYTILCPATSYSEEVPAILAELTSRGYEVIKLRNAWGGRFYQGVNVQLMSPAGVRVELQLHTPQSYAIKQKSHAVYEIRRDPASTPEEVAAATQASLDYNALVHVPRGATGIAWGVA